MFAPWWWTEVATTAETFTDRDTITDAGTATEADTETWFFRARLDLLDTAGAYNNADIDADNNANSDATTDTDSLATFVTIDPDATAIADDGGNVIEAGGGDDEGHDVLDAGSYEGGNSIGDEPWWGRDDGIEYHTDRRFMSTDNQSRPISHGGLLVSVVRCRYMLVDGSLVRVL